MNPLTNVKNITKLNETELATGSIHKKSWHDMYKDSAWIFIGGLQYELTEGDVLAVFSQYGEIENINLVRDKKTGKSKGYCFLCYSNQKSTVLAVDNFNGIKLCSRTIRVDHVANYKPPKENERDDEITKVLKSEGCAPQVVEKLLPKETPEDKSKKKKSKKEKKEKKKKKRKHKSDSGGSDEETHAAEEVKIKREKHDPGYDKYDTSSHENRYGNKRDHERRMNYSNGECSYSNKNDRPDMNRKHFKTEKSDVHEKYIPKIKTEPESGREYTRTDRNRDQEKDRLKLKSGTESRNRSDSDNHHASSKKHKRKKSSSSSDDDDEQTNDNRGKYRLKSKDRDKSKKHLKHKKKSQKVEDSDSSSSDDASSTQSSSEDEKLDDKYYKKDKYRTHYESISNREDSRDRSYHRTDDSFASSKSKHYDKAEKYTEYKSRTKYKDNERDDSYYKDSHYHKKKSNK